jgi:hypothetical protein
MPLLGIGRTHVGVGEGRSAWVRCLESGRRFTVSYPAVGEVRWEDGEIIDRDLDRLPASPLSDDDIKKSAHIACLDAYGAV